LTLPYLEYIYSKQIPLPENIVGFLYINCSQCEHILNRADPSTCRPVRVFPFQKWWTDVRWKWYV